MTHTRSRHPAQRLNWESTLTQVPGSALEQGTDHGPWNMDMAHTHSRHPAQRLNWALTLTQVPGSALEQGTDHGTWNMDNFRRAIRSAGSSGRNQVGS